MKRLTSIGIALAAACIALTPLIAQDSDSAQVDKATELKIKEPLMIPGKVLQPGKYEMRMMYAMQGRNVVQITDMKTHKVEATILAVPIFRNRTSGREELTYWETPSGEPPAIKDWFYPGTYYGMQFAYPKKEAAKLATMAKMKKNEKIPNYTMKDENAPLDKDTAFVIEIIDIPAEANGDTSSAKLNNSK